MMCAALPAIIAGLFGVFLLWLPISLQAQLVLSLAILGLMLLFMMRPQNKTFRLMTFVFSAVLALRYAFWRTTETLPNINELWNFIPGIILYAAEMYCLIMLAINFFIVADPLKRKPAPQLADDDKPTVDVFVPSYNESADLLALTLAAAKSSGAGAVRSSATLSKAVSSTEVRVMIGSGNGSSSVIVPVTLSLAASISSTSKPPSPLTLAIAKV